MRWHRILRRIARAGRCGRFGRRSGTRSGSRNCRRRRRSSRERPGPSIRDSLPLRRPRRRQARRVRGHARLTTRRCQRPGLRTRREIASDRDVARRFVVTVEIGIIVLVVVVRAVVLRIGEANAIATEQRLHTRHRIVRVVNRTVDPPRHASGDTRQNGDNDDQCCGEPVSHQIAQEMGTGAREKWPW